MVHSLTGCAPFIVCEVRYFDALKLTILQPRKKLLNGGRSRALLLLPRLPTYQRPLVQPASRLPLLPPLHHRCHHHTNPHPVPHPNKPATTSPTTPHPSHNKPPPGFPNSAPRKPPIPLPGLIVETKNDHPFSNKLRCWTVLRLEP